MSGFPSSHQLVLGQLDLEEELVARAADRRNDKNQTDEPWGSSARLIQYDSNDPHNHQQNTYRLHTGSELCIDDCCNQSRDSYECTPGYYGAHTAD